MKQNITLSLEKEVIKKSKMLAVKRDTSISKMIGDLLKEITEKEDEYEAAKKNAIDMLKRGFHFGGHITWTREDLYE